MVNIASVNKNLKDFVDSIEEAIKGGADDGPAQGKRAARRRVSEREARAVRVLTDRYGIPLIIDDDLETALQCGADGLHVGQEDIPAAQARKVLGPQKILGVTAKTEEQAKAALEAEPTIWEAAQYLAPQQKSMRRLWTMKL